MKKSYLFIVLGCLISSPLFAQQSALTIDQLLENVEQGKINDNSEIRREKQSLGRKGINKKSFYLKLMQRKSLKKIEALN